MIEGIGIRSNALFLRKGKCKVIEVALKCGYESVDAFSAAFKNLHGISPITAKHENYQLKSYTRVSFSMAIIGGEAMNYRVIRKEKQQVLGVLGSMDDNIWGQVKQDGRLNELEALGGSSESWGLCFGEDENNLSINYSC